MRIAVVILNWNTKNYLQQFLPGVLASAGCAPDGTPHGRHAVIVADNASDDGSQEFLKEQFPGVKVICLNKNYGFTGGYNKALARLDGYDGYLLLNSDIEVPEGWIEPLEAFMEAHPKCGICAPKLHAYQDKDRFEYAGAAGGFIDRYGFPFCRGRVLKWTEPDEGQFDEEDPKVFWATGACMLVRASLWKALGGLDDRFFAHMEEIDFCWRAALEGWSTCVVTSGPVVYHLGGGTLPASSPRKLKFNYRNNLLMLRNNLAKTLAKQYWDKGYASSKAAHKGKIKAGRRIFYRMLLDGASAMVFLVTGRLQEFKAVIKAHNEYRELKRTPSEEDLKNYLEHRPNACVTGIYNGCVPVGAIVFGRKSFLAFRQGIK